MSAMFDRGTSAVADTLDDSHGGLVRLQSLATGEVAFLAVTVRAPAARQDPVGALNPWTKSGGEIEAAATTVGGKAVSAQLDVVNGTTASLRFASVPAELRDTRSVVGLNLRLGRPGEGRPSKSTRRNC
jgi:hypothetical protein